MENHRPATDEESQSHDSLLADDGECKGHHHHIQSESQKKHLLYALVLTFAFVVVQIIVAAIANSLSLLADALHHLVDCIIVLTALLAVELLQRVPSESELRRVYIDESGHRHHFIELIVAVGNSLLLLGLSVGVIVDAAIRLGAHSHEDIDATLIVILAALSLIVNIVKIFLLHSHMAASLNVRAVYIHTLADCAGAIALLAGGIVLMVTGDNEWDGIAALAIAALVIVNLGWVIVPTARLLWQGPDHTASSSLPTTDSEESEACPASDGISEEKAQDKEPEHLQYRDEDSNQEQTPPQETEPSDELSLEKVDDKQ